MAWQPSITFFKKITPSNYLYERKSNYQMTVIKKASCLWLHDIAVFLWFHIAQKNLMYNEVSVFRMTIARVNHTDLR